MTSVADTQHVILVTGPSGAGRTTAIHALEDSGFEAIDNLPLTLIPHLLKGPRLSRPMALGVDTRNRDFSVAQFIETIDALARDRAVDLQVLYVTCASDVLVRRFSETRRRHPLAPAEHPLAGIERELELLVPIMARADVVVDTSDLSPHDLKSEVERWFAPEREKRLAISVQSFSYKRGIPRGVDTMFDCRFLRNPYWDPDLRGLSGRDVAVQRYVEADSSYDSFLSHVMGLLSVVIPAHAAEGRSHLSVAFGCTGGQHRSVALAQKVLTELQGLDWRVSVRHRELERNMSIDAKDKRKSSA